MIFIILLVVMFGVILGTMQFGAVPTTATPRAQVYAVNMETWHQAAMMALTFQNPSQPSYQNESQQEQAGNNDCSGNANSCVVALNSFIWTNNSATGPLLQNWKEYQPIVNENNPTNPSSGGWQSFLLKNIDGTCANASQGCTPSYTENYVLTVFRGFGYGGTYTNTTTGSSSLGVDSDQFASALSKTIQDRMGVGVLSCSNNVCSFSRNAAYLNTQGTATQTDKPLQFDTTSFTTPKISSVLPGTGAAATFNGLPAIMTRVGGGSGAVPQCPQLNIIFPVETAGSSYTSGNAPVLADPCYADFQPTNASNNALGAVTPLNNNYKGSATATCDANGNWVSFNLNCTDGGGGALNCGCGLPSGSPGNCTPTCFAIPPNGSVTSSSCSIIEIHKDAFWFGTSTCGCSSGGVAFCAGDDFSGGPP